MTRDDETCLKRIQRLEEENSHLRRAAEAFGQLAERLNHQLAEERRRSGERRRLKRPTPDRRQAAADATGEHPAG